MGMEPTKYISSFMLLPIDIICELIVVIKKMGDFCHLHYVKLLHVL